MSVPMSMLALLAEGAGYGLRLKNEFEARTGGVWPLNVGQVYATLARLERDGLIRTGAEGNVEGQKTYELTDEGKRRLAQWFGRPTDTNPPARDELVLKLVMAASNPSVDPAEVIQVERRSSVQLLQEFTRLKRYPPSDADLGWIFLLESLIFQAEARVRWLDACEARLSTGPSGGRHHPGSRASTAGRSAEPEEVRR